MHRPTALSGRTARHDRRFTAEVLLHDRVLAQGAGRTKKQAEQAAALAALRKLQG